MNEHTIPASNSLEAGQAALDTVLADTVEVAKPHRTTLFADVIVPNPFQPRKVISQAEIADLAASISEHGLLQGIIVREDPNSSGLFQIADGERRWRAIGRLIDQGFLPKDCQVDVTVRVYTDRQMLEIAMIANMKRKQLNALDEAWGYAELEKMGMKQEEMAKKFESSQPAISNKMRLLKLPESVKDAMRSDNLSTGHGIALLALESTAEQGKWALRTLENNWSVKALEGEIRAHKAEATAQAQPQLPVAGVAAEPARLAGGPLIDVVPDVDPSQLPPAPPRDNEMSDKDLAAFKGEKLLEKPVVNRESRFNIGDRVEWTISPGEFQQGNVTEILAGDEVEVASNDKTYKKAEGVLRHYVDQDADSAPAPEAPQAVHAPEISEPAKPAASAASEAPVVTGPPVMAPIPAGEAAWLKSKGLSTAIAIAHFRRFYGICEDNEGLSRMLQDGGLGDIFDTLEAIYPGDTN